MIPMRKRTQRISVRGEKASGAARTAGEAEITKTAVIEKKTGITGTKTVETGTETETALPERGKKAEEESWWRAFSVSRRL